MSEEIIDLKEVLERVQDDKELLGELFDIYQEDFVIKRQALEEGITTRDMTKVKETAHSMKGASGNISAKPIYAVCLKIEQLAKEGKMDGMAELLPSLDGYFEQVKTFAIAFKKENGG
jgi:HPt (histidine-containing phosphotransfer) domain-containing protein